MNTYEVTVLLPEGTKDKEVLGRLEKEIKEAGGKIDKSEEWGKRELAYAIKKHGGPGGGYKEGVYHYFEVTLEPDKIGGINRFLETSEGVLRHLVVRTNSKSKILNLKQSLTRAKARNKQIKSTKSKTKREKAKPKKVVKRKNGDKKS